MTVPWSQARRGPCGLEKRSPLSEHLLTGHQTRARRVLQISLKYKLLVERDDTNGDVINQVEPKIMTISQREESASLSPIGGRSDQDTAARNSISRHMLGVLVISMSLSIAVVFGVWSYHAGRLHEIAVRSHAAKVAARVEATKPPHVSLLRL